MTAPTRFYLGRAAAPVNPNLSSVWDDTNDLIRYGLFTTKQNTALSSIDANENVTTTPYDVIKGQWVSAALPAKTIGTGTFDIVVRVSEANAAADAFLQVVVRVVNSAGTVERGVLYAGQTQTTVSSTPSDPNGEYGTASSTRVLATVAMSSLAVTAGDRLVVEVGHRVVNTVTTVYNLSMRAGDPTATADFALSAGLTTDLCPWIEFTEDIFADPNITVSVGQASETDTGLAATTNVGATVVAGQASETDTGLAATATVGAVVAAGIATETDTALAASIPSVPPITINAGIAEETDTGLAATIAVGARVTVGQASETDTGLAATVAAGALVAVGQATETDTALAATVTYPASPITIAVGQARETDTALSVVVTGGAVVTDAANSVNDIVLTGDVTVFYEPPVVPVPATVEGVAYEVALAHSNMTITNGRPDFDVTSAHRLKLRERIVVSGKDVTFWRGIATPPVSYQLQEPGTYGTGSISFPQAAFWAGERLGTGELWWLRPQAKVIIQAVNTETDEVVATRWRGFIAAPDVSGSDNTFQLGGELMGRAAMKWKPFPLFRSVVGSGTRAYDEISHMGFRFEPRLGPDTGIPIQSFGGMWTWDYLLQLCAMSQDLTGNQWTIKFDRTDHVWRFVRKDTTTIDATVYFDDAMIVPNLRRDIAEEPNRAFVTGVNPEGLKVRNGVYPGLAQGPAPDFPNTGGDPITQGDTDADTDSGDGVSILIWRLIVTGYLSRQDSAGAFDVDVTRAVKELQRDAGLTVNGNVGPATWDSLFDLDETGFSLTWSKILPMAERSKVKQWYRTGSGSLKARNPNYDPHEIVRDTAIDLGTGFRKDQMREWAQTEIATEANWVGTIQVNGLAVIAGEHNPGDPLTTPDVMPARAIQEGMNLWVPLWDGGTLFHISTVDVSADTVTLHVDTRARDSLKVWEIIQRNREARSDPARAFFSRISSRIPKDFGTFSEVGGLVNEGVDLRAGEWNIFPVVAGQAGTLEKVVIRTLGVPTEFVVAMFGREVGTERLNHMFPNPLADKSPWRDETVRNRLEDRWVIYSAGTPEQPCGYWPHVKTDETGSETAAPVTGVHKDDASAGYFTAREPVIWVAIYPADNCRLPAGRIFWPQLEEGS